MRLIFKEVFLNKNDKNKMEKNDRSIQKQKKR